MDISFLGVNRVGMGWMSPKRRQLLITDGHNSHLILDVVNQTMQMDLDLLTIPIHTSRALEPLDVSMLKPFKIAFGRFENSWILVNRGKGVVAMEGIAKWVSLH